MPLAEPEATLLRRVEAFSLDDEFAAFCFTQRLARDNDWSLAFATRVVTEYKRFMFLAVTAGHGVSPSDQVDQAWHLHLVYTRSYWDVFCNEVLRSSVHHGPTKGGHAEQTKFVDMYEQTKTTYREKFGEDPPSDIWPSAEERFDSAGQRKWISLQKYWIIRKPNFRKVFKTENLPLAAGAVLPALLFAWSPFDLSGIPFLVFYAIIALMAWLGAFLLNHLLRTNGDSQWQLARISMKLSPNHLAYLAGGRQRLLESAVSELLIGSFAKASRQQLRHGTKPISKKLSLVARAIHRKISAGASIDYEGIQDAAKLSVAKVSGELMNAGLIQSTAKRHALGWMTGLMFAGVFGIGVARICMAIPNQRPFGFLALEMLVFALMAAVPIYLIPFRTKAGEMVLKQWQVKANKKSTYSFSKNIGFAKAAFFVSVLGPSVLVGTVFECFQKDIDHVLASKISTDDGGGSSRYGEGYGDGGRGGGGGGWAGCGG